ncbi:MAG: hypothetical protein HWQ38_27085 [Nostoc sp. NMS7]|uniref:hypothetical protein n=1 Tax=Nostoc sp. NMS7 TaxID=2815391 RepID=UPI0025E34B08|nr:hypothetical protein [Nostoc sp. NMS7]MBN3949937.1 hypothetical protein [Nostoc sp. NMS7]
MNSGKLYGKSKLCSTEAFYKTPSPRRGIIPLFNSASGTRIALLRSLTLRTFKLYFYELSARARAIASPNYLLMALAESNFLDVDRLLKEWASGTIKNHLLLLRG